jgi:hypothetical protein
MNIPNTNLIELAQGNSTMEASLRLDEQIIMARVCILESALQIHDGGGRSCVWLDKDYALSLLVVEADLLQTDIEGLLLGEQRLQGLDGSAELGVRDKGIKTAKNEGGGSKRPIRQSARTYRLMWGIQRENDLSCLERTFWICVQAERGGSTTSAEVKNLRGPPVCMAP